MTVIKQQTSSLIYNGYCIALLKTICLLLHNALEISSMYIVLEWVGDKGGHRCAHEQAPLTTTGEGILGEWHPPAFTGTEVSDTHSYCSGHILMSVIGLQEKKRR